MVVDWTIVITFIGDTLFQTRPDQEWGIIGQASLLHSDTGSSKYFIFYNMKGERILEGQTQFVIFRMIRSLYCHHLSLLPTFTFTYDWKIFSTTWEAKDYCIWSLRDRKEKLFSWILFRSRTSTIIMMHRQIRFDCIMSSLTMSLLLLSIFSA